MHEWAVLGVVAAAFYLIECCAWIVVPCRACFRHPGHGRWRAVAAADAIGNDRGGLLLTSPVDFSGAVVQSCEWPLSLSPDGVVNVSAVDRDDQEPDYVAFEDIETISAVLDTVVINQRIAIKARSAVAAAELAALLENLKSARRRDREKLIQSAVADRVSITGIKERWAWFQQNTRVVRLASMLSTAWLFLAAPMVLLLFGPIASWPYLLAGLFLCGVATSTIYFRTHRRLFGAAASDRWVQALSMAFFPLAAFRACDRLSKELMWRFEPVALVAAFCEPRAAADAIRPMVFDISRAAGGAQRPEAAGCRSWHRTAVTHHVTRMLRAVECDPMVAPPRDDDSMAAFCPRCHTQYSEGRAACSVCADVPLEPFAARAGRPYLHEVSNSKA